MAKIEMKVQKAKGILILKQRKKGSAIMSISDRSPFIKSMKLKAGQIVTLTIK